jgi:hypothetical protein
MALQRPRVQPGADVHQAASDATHDVHALPPREGPGASFPAEVAGDGREPLAGGPGRYGFSSEASAGTVSTPARGTGAGEEAG